MAEFPVLELHKIPVHHSFGQKRVIRGMIRWRRKIGKLPTFRIPMWNGNTETFISIPGSSNDITCIKQNNKGQQ